ncbi:substrate-binding domain-containing protein [Sphaerotilus microaerophilus]|uniref:Molybdenum ABC transporter substrate-binding protein n=1 Tax=Sphaerotilus microaerophilus TaxID=2914710 RepID=A0ABN6PMM3_9BURK|nr:substrate-binding domain-containing protein [Sphaerotilus sp. FB-5]BDI05317.1 molybdenum ABC transporter substrate-binding protein [Sphaerotilus sp. FB-5]
MHRTHFLTWGLSRGLFRLLLAACLTAGGAGSAWAADIRVITSGAFTEAYKKLIPLYEAATGNTVISAFGASIGNAPDSIPSRLARGEAFDLVILSEGGLEALVKSGQVQPGSRIDLARSKIGAAVRKGTPRPDISSVEALKATLLNAKSVAYSASASGTYLSTELFPKLGVAERLKDTGRRILSERVGAVVARGDAELGFQQVSELIYFTELDFIGTLPEEVQQTLYFSAGLVRGAKEEEAARQLARFLASAAVAEIVRPTGLDPVGAKR